MTISLGETDYLSDPVIAAMRGRISMDLLQSHMDGKGG